MSRLKTVGRIAFLVVVFSLPTSHAAEYSPVPPGVYNRGFDPSYTQEWKEANVPLPAYPQDADLLAVTMGSTDTLKLYIDSKSISRADDFVFRLTYVVESRSGVRNVFFEGFRCATNQYKTYATGASDRTLVPVKNPVWRDVINVASNAFRYRLKQNACDISSALTPRDFLQRLKVGTYSN